MVLGKPDRKGDIPVIIGMSLRISISCVTNFKKRPKTSVFRRFPYYTEPNQSSSNDDPAKLAGYLTGQMQWTEFPRVRSGPSFPFPSTRRTVTASGSPLRSGGFVCGERCCPLRWIWSDRLFVGWGENALTEEDLVRYCLALLPCGKCGFRIRLALSPRVLAKEGRGFWPGQPNGSCLSLTLPDAYPLCLHPQSATRMLRVGGSAELASGRCVRAGRAFKNETWRDCYPPVYSLSVRLCRTLHRFALGLPTPFR